MSVPNSLYTSNVRKPSVPLIIEVYKQKARGRSGKERTVIGRSIMDSPLPTGLQLFNTAPVNKNKRVSLVELYQLNQHG